AALVRGMRGAVSFGTAAESGLKALPIYVYGKTGTSTSSSGFRTQGWFVGFGSVSEGDDQPLIAVLAFLRHSHGSGCAPLRRPIFAEYARLAGGTSGGRSVGRDEPSRRGALAEATETTIAAQNDLVQDSCAGPVLAGYSSGASLDRVVLAIGSAPQSVKVHMV